MKTALSILLLTLTLNLSAQKNEPLKVIGVYTAAIVLNAVGDGLNDEGTKGWGHACNAASIGLLLSSPFIINYDRKKWYWYLASYTSLRIGLFDYTYNTTRGLPLNYIGGTSTWDQVLGKLNPPSTYLLRGVFFTVGISIPIHEFRKPLNENN
jgi:hypothetical protein